MLTLSENCCDFEIHFVSNFNHLIFFLIHFTLNLKYFSVSFKILIKYRHYLYQFDEN